MNNNNNNKNIKFIFNYIPLFFRIILNRSNLSKIKYIFILGLISRIFVNNISYISGFLNQSSVMFCSFFSLLIIIIHEFIDYINNIITSCLFNFYTFIIKMFAYINENLLYLKNSLKISCKYFIRKFYYHIIIDNKMLMISNINIMEPYRETEFNDKPSSGNSPANSSTLPPTNTRIRDLKTEAKAKSSQEAPLDYQEKDKLITKYKDEFKEFYTTYRKSIKLSNYELEKYSIKVAIAYSNGAFPLEVMEILPENIRPIYKEFIRKQRVNKMFALLNKKNT